MTESAPAPQAGLGESLPDPLAAQAPISLRSVAVSFGDVSALSGVSLDVQRGHIAAIIGASGAGKTTLLRVIIGLLRPTAGSVQIEGEDIARLSERQLTRVRAKFGMVFQYSALLDSLTVLENVALPLKEHDRSSQPARNDRARALLDSLGLSGVEQRYPSELSGGMRKRVGLARALIRHPSILVYDEPASGLDPLTAARVDELIASTRDRFGVTSIVISHDMAQVARLADRLYVLDQGQLVAEGPPRELWSEPGSLAARFFEASRVD